MNWRLTVLVAVICHAGLVTFPAAAADPRIRTEPYHSEGVVKLTAHLGFQMALEFQADEIIENVAIGDSASWQVTPNRRGNMLIVKPVNRALPTNMTVMTTQRRYTFALDSKSAENVSPSQMTFVLKFVGERSGDSPSDSKSANGSAQGVTPSYPEPERTNSRYSYKGSVEIVPAEIFDDSQATYFRWSAATPAPAIFLLGAKGQRSIVNHSYVGPYVVVDRISKRFHLQLGDFSTTIFNDGFTAKGLGEGAPKLRPSDPNFIQRIFGQKKQRRDNNDQ